MHTAATNSEALVTINTIVNMLQRSKASIYRDIAIGDFPKPLKLGHSSRWRHSEVEAYIQSLANER